MLLIYFVHEHSFEVPSNHRAQIHDLIEIKQQLQLNTIYNSGDFMKLAGAINYSKLLSPRINTFIRWRGRH